MATVEIAVPDIGDFHDVPVIEVLIKPGDVIEKEAPLATLESEKATMEIPADAAGTVRDVRIKIGDRVSRGSVVATLEVADGAGTATTPAPASAPAASPAPVRAAPAELVVPDIGDFHDVPVIEVLVKPGDRVEADAPLITLESEKATMEIPASSAGTIGELRIAVGDRVSKGTVIATLEPAQVAAAQTPGAAPQRPADSPQPAAATAPEPPAAAPIERPRSAAALAPSSYGAPGTNGTSANGASSNGSHAATPAANGAPATGLGAQAEHALAAPPPHASPALRRFARELGVDLSRVRGSGPNGRITRDDVQGFVKHTLASAPAAPSAPAAGAMPFHLPPWPSLAFERFGPIERQPLSRIQKLSGPNLARNWVMIPHVFQSEDADITELEAFRKQLNAERSDVKVTLLAFTIKAVTAVLARHPAFNSSLDGDELIVKRYYNIGFAADTPSGLVVPVIRAAERKGVLEIARETAALAAKAREGKLAGSDMQGGTFSISSLGGIGGTSFTPIVNAPEVAILGVARQATKPVWDGSAFVPRLILPLTVSYDHRAIDGAAAARFIVDLAATLGDLRRSLL